MAVVFYMPEGGADDTANSSGNNSAASSSGGSNASSTSQSPNTTTSATQTPMQSPLLPTPEQMMMSMFETLYRINLAPTFQYPQPPPSPCCLVHSPPPTGDLVFFPRSLSTPRTPRTSVSFAADDDTTFLSHSNSQQPPQSAPPMPTHSHSQPQFQHIPCSHYQYTPPPTPFTPNNSCGGGISMASASSLPQSNAMSTSSAQTRLHRCHSDVQRRSRRTSTHKDEQECHSEHETSVDELDDRFDNFTAGRERLQEFNGRIPPRKKKKDVPKSKPEMKFKTFIWPTVVTVIVVAIGCGFLVTR